MFLFDLKVLLHGTETTILDALTKTPKHIQHKYVHRSQKFLALSSN